MAIAINFPDARPGMARFIQRLLVRSDLTDGEQQLIAALPGDQVEIATHRDLVSPGQRVDFACLVIDGLAARFDQLASGSRQLTALHIAGDMCDLHSVPAPIAGWGIQALSNTSYLRVPHHALRALVEQHPPIAMAFWRDTIVDASILSKWITALGRRSAEARLAHLLCEMGLRLEQSGEGHRQSFDLRATQAHIGDFLGVTSVHVSRSLQNLRGRSLVTTNGSHYDIPDFDALARFAEFDPTYLLLDEPSVHSNGD